MSKTSPRPTTGDRPAASRARTLLELLGSVGSVAIVCHDDPDPDCLASALALEGLARQQGVSDVTTMYGGGISHRQNWAMIERLGMDVRPYDHAVFEASELVAFVDHSVPGRNNPVPADADVDVVVDHHPHDPVDGIYVDHRPSAGATATVFTEYVRDLGITPTPRLATALLFGIRRETLDFMRNSTTLAEYSAAQYLHLFADLDALQTLSESLFAPATLDAIARVIDNRDCRGSCLVSSAGRLPNREAVPLSADYLLNLDGTTTTVVFGVADDAVEVSARTLDPDVHVGNRLQRAFRNWGSAGGHRSMAGAGLPLDGVLDGDADLDPVEGLVTRLVFESFDDLV